nr:MAG TPA: hypothetical protein [Herelleviridae sp.]
MPNAEYLKNKSGETFYPVVNEGSILFAGSTDNQPYTYTDLKQHVYNTIHTLYKSTIPSFDTRFDKTYNSYSINRTNFFDIHNSNVGSDSAILSDAGVHGIRIKNGTLQLTFNGEWKSTKPGPDAYKSVKVTKFRAVLGEKVAYSKPNDLGDSYFSITWTDPGEVKNQTWAGTKIIRIATYKFYSSELKKFYSLGSSVLTDATYGKYCTLILDSKVKNKYQTNGFIDNIQEYLMGFVDKTKTPIDTNNSTDEDILKDSYSRIFYMVIPYSEDGLEGASTIYSAPDFGLNYFDEIQIKYKYTASRYCDFENKQTYYVGQNAIASPTPNRTVGQWACDRTEIQRNMNGATRVIVDKDGYVIGAFINPWGTTNKPENPIELKKSATKVNTVIKATMVCADSDAYENYDCNFELQDENKPDEAYVSVGANQNYDVYGIGPNDGADMSWLQKQVDAFVNYPTITPVSATIPANCTVSNNDYVIDKSFKEVTIDDTASKITFRKWVYDPTGTKHKWKAQSKQYKSGEVVPVDIMVLQTLKYYKITVLETGIQNTVKKAVYSISEKPLDGYKPHPAFIQMINGKAVVVPYILTSAFPCTVVDNSDNTTKVIGDCGNAPYYLATASSIVSPNDDVVWSDISAKMEIRSIPNVPPTVISSPKRIESLANKKSTEIKWRGIGYAQFALTQLRMLIELGTTSVDTLLHNHNDPSSISATVLNKKGEDIKKYCWGTRYSPFMLCFPNSLPYNSFGGGFSKDSNTEYYNSTQGWRNATGTPEGTWNPDLIAGTSINYPGSTSNVNSDYKEMDHRINTNWHNELRYVLQTSNSERAVNDSYVEFVKAKSADIVTPGATWAMGNETAITYSIGALSMSANRNGNHGGYWTSVGEVNEADEVIDVNGWKNREKYMTPIDGSAITSLQKYFTGTIIPEQVSVTYSVLPAITSRADGTNTDGQTTVGPGEQKSDDSDIIRCSIGKQILTPVFSFHGEENFGWGNYTPFNEDTIASYSGVYSMGPYHSRGMAMLYSIAETTTEITSAVSSDFGYVYGYTVPSGSRERYFNITCFGIRRRNDSAAYCSWKYPKLSDTKAFPWVINTRGNSCYYDSLGKSEETEITGNTSDILGVIMASSPTEYNMGGKSDENWSYKHVSVFASAGWTGMALNSLNYDLNTSYLSYADTLKDNTTPEIGNYQPRIYTYPQ